jgi:hypothetical protein
VNAIKFFKGLNPPNNKFSLIKKNFNLAVDSQQLKIKNTSDYGNTFYIKAITSVN